VSEMRVGNRLDTPGGDGAIKSGLSPLDAV
jgi:hypothetical protein